MPTKAELVQLQKLYKTDEKIGERLGGVPPYLVAYWRRKKNVPRHSQPKFSESEVRTLWERYGDDDKCGLELGISKAAFYNWRRKYGIKEKPAFLKLEQLELNLAGARATPHSNALYGKQSMIQKALAAAAETDRAEIGQEIAVEPNMALADCGADAVLSRFRQNGSDLVWNSARIVISTAGCCQGSSNGENHRTVREFAKRQGIAHILDIRDGIGNQVAVERGLILPGQLGFATDRYASAYGCIGAIGRAVTIEQMAELWAHGLLYVKVPETVRIDLSGKRPRGVYTRDVCLHLMKHIAPDHIADRMIEFHGPLVSQMTISERFTLCNQVIDMGAQGAVCPFDSQTRRFLSGRAPMTYKPLAADKNAEYSSNLQISIEELVPQISTAGGPASVRAVAEMEDKPVNQVIFGTAANGRFDDLRIGAEILKGKKVHPDCRMLVYPGSHSVYLDALKKGLIRVYLEAGAVVMNPSSAIETGSSMQRLVPGERCLATCNQRAVGDYRQEGAEILFCSPATAAASALNAAITSPERYLR